MKHRHKWRELNAEGGFDRLDWCKCGSVRFSFSKIIVDKNGEHCKKWRKYLRPEKA